MKKRTVVLSSLVAATLVVTGKIMKDMFLNPQPPEVDNDKKHIACIGDSITFGAGVGIFKRNEESYPAFLQMHLNNQWQTLNYGLSGRTLLDEGDVPYRKEKFYNISKEIKADVYIIMLGTNDSKPYNWNLNYEKQLKNFINEYQGLDNHPKVVVMQPPRSFSPKPGKPIKFDIQNNIIEKEIYPMVKNAVEETGAYYIDLYELTKDHPEWMADGVHPNAIGNKFIAEYIYDQLIEKEVIK